MMFMLLMSSALAGGGGMYLETLGGAATTDTTGFVARGGSAGLAVGGYWGTYRTTFRYGKYWRVGLVLLGSSVEPLDQLLDTKYLAGVRVGRGVDVMNIGAWWSVSTGYSLGYQTESMALALDLEDLHDPSHGVFVSGALGVSYNFSHFFSWNIRYEPGLILDGGGLARQSGFGTGLVFRVPLVRTHWREKE